MRKKIENLRDLFIEQGRELYDASRLEQLELPGVQKHATNPKLKKVIDQQLNNSKIQGKQLREILDNMDVIPEGEKNECCHSIFKQTKSIIDRSKDSRVRDSAIINSLQRLNHNNITGFGSLASYARDIGHEEFANSLHNLMNEEKAIDNQLSDLAEKEINKKAITAIAL
jgi:ferritin-like metal-binding protein YciE